jgi:hypothetical protein
MNEPQLKILFVLSGIAIIVAIAFFWYGYVNCVSDVETCLEERYGGSDRDR